MVLRVRIFSVTGWCFIKHAIVFSLVEFMPLGVRPSDNSWLEERELLAEHRLLNDLQRHVSWFALSFNLSFQWNLDQGLGDLPELVLGKGEALSITSGGCYLCAQKYSGIQSLMWGRVIFRLSVIGQVGTVGWFWARRSGWPRGYSQLESVSVCVWGVCVNHHGEEERRKQARGSVELTACGFPWGGQGRALWPGGRRGTVLLHSREGASQARMRTPLELWGMGRY